jgi:hypothetical protein
MRINETRTVEKVFEEKRGESRGRERPRHRWIDDVEDDSRNMGTKRWRIKALGRAEWASIIKQAKAKLKIIPVYLIRVILRAVSGNRRAQGPVSHTHTHTHDSEHRTRP